MKTRRKRLFRARRRAGPPSAVLSVDIRGGSATIGGRPLPSVEAFLAAQQSGLRPGIRPVVVEHDESCRYPTGGECTCVRGPRIWFADHDAEAN
jgi:hypothetical protein